MKTFLAIDFGTTQTSVALLKETSANEPDVIEINDGQRAVKAIITAMQLDLNGNIAFFGAKALAKAEDAPERTFQNFKVFLGKEDGSYQLKTEQEEYTPDMLSLLFLTHLRELIEEHYFNGTALTEIADIFCVIGCPSEWNELQKNKLRTIAQQAGFPRIKTCDEPIGVIYYNHFFGKLKLENEQKILVYDFGGGTTDVAIAEVKLLDNGLIEPSIVAVGGLPDLGGRNFDEAIASNYLSECQYDIGSLSPKDRLHDQWVINLASRGAKEELSEKISVEKTINRLKVTGGQKPAKLSLSKQDFEALCKDLIEKFSDPVFDALTVADLSVEDIDTVILAGGSSAMPHVLENMRKIFPATNIIVSPSTEVIAQGLAVYGKVEVLGMSARAFHNEAVSTSKEEHTADYELNTLQPVRKKRKWLWVAVITLIAFLGGGFFYMNYRVNKMAQERAVLQEQLLEANRQVAVAKGAQSSSSSSEEKKSGSGDGAVGGAVIGGIIGFFLGGPWGAAAGAAIGAGIGSD